MKIITPIDQFVDRIRRAVFSGKFTPGSKLKEKKISEWLGMSRMPVREAFRILEAPGLVEIEPNKGAKVPLISLEDLEEIYEARVLLEVYCLRKFVSLISDQDLAAIEKICEKIEAAIDQKDPLSYFDHSFDFHKYYISHCQNKLLESVFLRMENSIRCLQFSLDKNQEFYRKSLNEHRQILQALRAKDADRCEKLIRLHLESGYKSNKKIVSQLKSELNAARLVLTIYRYHFFISRFNNLPAGFWGSASTNINSLGTLKAARRLFKKALSATGSGSWPFRAIIKAVTRSPYSLSGSPTTAHS